MKLSDHELELMELRFIQGKSVMIIARRFNVSRFIINYQIRRAVKRLFKFYLGKYDKEIPLSSSLNATRRSGERTSPTVR